MLIFRAWATCGVTASNKFVGKRTHDEANEAQDRASKAAWLFIYVKERVYCPSISVESLSMASDPERSGDLMANFNKFLLQIANEITSDELEEMKFVCEEVLPRGKLELIAKPRELLNFLKRSGKIRPGDVMYLVTLLEDAGLVQLAERVKEGGKTSILLFSFITTFFARGDVVMK